jgi:glycopeptide antibiotics resistance protein
MNSPSAFRDLAWRYGLAAMVAILIAYGSLYPFIFHAAGPVTADLSHFLASWRQPLTSRGDVLANLLLYIPLGLAATLAFGHGGGRYLGAAMAVLCGALLSLLIELAQYYDATRVSAFSDFTLNVVGDVAGAVIALTVGARIVRTSWPQGGTPAFARLLLLAWLGWRLYPYVPTMEIHKYWRSLKPVLFAPGVGAHDVFRFTALWLSVIFLFRTGVHRSMALLLLAILGFFAAKASIIDQVLFLPELLGAALAFLLSPLILGRVSTIGVPITAAMLLLAVILTRILPWQFALTQKPFQWIPFFGFLQGSEQIGIIVLLQKLYLYGAEILLLVKARIRLRVAVGLECAILLATSLLQTFMVNRSAEISDAFLALGLGLVYAWMRRRYQRDAETPGQSAPRAAELRS